MQGPKCYKEERFGGNSAVQTLSGGGQQSQLLQTRQALRPAIRDGPTQLIAPEMQVREQRQAVGCAPAQTLRVSCQQHCHG